MSVAPSFVNFTKLSEPYEKNGKMYITVQNPSTKTVREVRWYEEKTGSKTIVAAAANSQPTIFNQKKALGFEKGYITVFKGDIDNNLEWFHYHTECRYSTLWGWYVISTEEVPAGLPLGVETVRLEWAPIASPQSDLLITANSNAIKSYVDSLIYEASPSQFVGVVGTRIEIVATVIKDIELQNDFGHSNNILHILEDDNKNEYVWITAARHLTRGVKFKFRGTIKEHKIFKNKKQTILTRCQNFEEVKGE